MGADDIVLTADSVQALARQHAGGLDEWPRGFWIGLACAAAVHAALIIGVATHAPRYLGDAGGSPDAINVELVDEADLRSRETGTDAPPPGTPAPPPQPQSVQAQETPPPQPETKRPAEKTPPEPKAEQPAEAAPADQPASVLPVEKEKPQPAPPQEERVKESAQQKKADPKVELKPPEQLDLSLPFAMTMKATPYEEFGRSSAINRPSGITRSGENDNFGRGVIRALKKTMPPATGTKGRVTIKLILDERGNISTVKLVQGAGIRDLDEGVMFSAQQASFPFPPKNSTVADRTFLITYVYK